MVIRKRYILAVALTGAAAVGIAWLAFYFLRNRFSESIRRGKEEHTRLQMTAVREGTTSRIFDPAPELIEELVNDRPCADKVTEIYFTGDFTPDISDKRFGDLKQCPHLKIICLEYVGCSDALLENIQGLPSLEELSFHRAGVSRQGMRWVIGFPGLKRISFDDRTDLGSLEALKGHVGIESLGLYEYRTTPDGLAFLKTLPNLRELSLELQLQDDGALDLRALRKLEKLSLGGSEATDAALESVREMKNLTDLTLSSHAVTDVGLKHLRGLTALERLDLQFTQVTDKGVKELQKALPNCKIKWNPPTTPAH